MVLSGKLIQIRIGLRDRNYLLWSGFAQIYGPGCVVTYKMCELSTCGEFRAFHMRQLPDFLPSY